MILEIRGNQADIDRGHDGRLGDAMLARSRGARALRVDAIILKSVLPFLLGRTAQLAAVFLPLMPIVEGPLPSFSTGRFGSKEVNKPRS